MDSILLVLGILGLLAGDPPASTNAEGDPPPDDGLDRSRGPIGG